MQMKFSLFPYLKRVPELYLKNIKYGEVTLRNDPKIR